MSTDEAMSPAILEATDLARHYSVSRGPFKGEVELQALRHASFEMTAGKTLAIVGESGCGKSTLARLVTMIEPATSGQLILDGIELSTASVDQRRELRKAVQIVFQDPYGSLNPRKKIGAILEEPLKVNAKMTSAERKAAVASMISIK